MRRQLGALLTAWVLACGAAPLAAIEYHTQEESLPEPPGDDGLDPLSAVQTPDASQGASIDGEPSMIEGFCDCCSDCCSDWWGYDGIYRPRSWIVRADAVWLQRSEPNDTTLLVGDGLIVGAQLLGPEDSVGYDVSVMEVDPHGNGLEFRLFDVEDFRGERNVQAANPFIFTTPPTGLFAGANQVDISTTTELRSMELHKLTASHYGTWMWGVRYLNLDESLNIDSVTLAGTVFVTQSLFETNNDLVGLQIGFGTMLFEHNCWRVQFCGKGGAYYCETDSRVAFTAVNVSTNPDTLLQQSGASEDSERVATVGELRLSLLYQFTPALCFRTGYEFLFLDGVGLATEQVGTTTSLTSPPAPPVSTNINHGTVWFQGAFMGLEYNF